MLTPDLDAKIVSTVSTKNETAKNKGSRKGSAVTLRAVLSAISGHERARRVALDRFKTGGHSLDRFTPTERRAWADALAFAEDAVELERGASALTTRGAIRFVRRRLELEALT